jgi:signal transduction histidine kinase
MLSLIEKNVVYSNKIINDLLDYSREIELEPTSTSPSSIVKESLAIVDIPKRVQVIDLTGNELKLMIDIEKTKRAFVNIIKNAVEAMPKGGKLTIASQRIGECLEIAFSDTGLGMSKKTLENLWTPLFTTKAKGMGFGLPICKRFIEAHGGSISVESTLGKGTTIKVTFPIKPKTKEGGGKIWVKPLESSLLTMTRT